MNHVVNEDGLRLDVFLAKQENITRSNVNTILEKDGAKVNGTIIFKSGYKLKKGDIVEFTIPEPTQLDLTPANIPLDIIYQDEDLIIVNKPQGMVVHPATSYKKNDTLVNALLYNIDNLSGINGVIRPGIVHRLDKDTSGLLVVAKNDEAHKSLAAQIEKKDAQRIYIGLCDGNFKEDDGIINANIARSKTDRKKMAIDPKGRVAITHYHVLERFGNYTLVRFDLKTGRTHQIRVHAKSIHHPIVGDAVYGGSQTLYKNGQLLHAYELKLTHPRTGEQLDFKAEIPAYFNEIIEKLRKTTLK